MQLRATNATIKQSMQLKFPENVTTYLGYEALCKCNRCIQTFMFQHSCMCCCILVKILHYNNFIATTALKQLHCSNYTATIELQKMQNSNCTAIIATIYAKTHAGKHPRPLDVSFVQLLCMS